VKYRLPVKVVVVKNNTLGQIKWEQIAFLGNPEYGCELQPIDFAQVAAACGARGFRVETPQMVGSVLAEALAAPGPAVVEALVDALEPPMPSKVTAAQTRHFAASLLRGEADRSRIMMTVLADKMRELGRYAFGGGERRASRR
jgi:pyruvate dehydrogenase (quinone)/pyruvate oxidase